MNNVTRSDAGDTVSALCMVARAARFLMFAVSGLWFLSKLMVSVKPALATVGPSAAAKATAIALAVGMSAVDSVLAWILFGFIWFFAAWFAEVAARQRSAE